jgi:acetyl esterase/lipase
MSSRRPARPRGQTTVAYGRHREAFGSLWWPKADRLLPLVVLLHGGFWRSRMGLTATEPLAAGISRLGAAVWNVEYRRGHRAGGWQDTLADVAAAVDFVPRLAARCGIDTRRTVVVGHSAGGQLALWTAMRALGRGGHVGEEIGAPPPTAPAAVVSLAGISDMAAAAEQRLGDDAVAEFLGDGIDQHPERFRATSPRAALPLGVPQYLVHGDADQRVPFAMSSDYAAAATASGDRVELVRVVGGDHVCVLDPYGPAGRQVLATVGKALGDLPAQSGRWDRRARPRGEPESDVCLLGVSEGGGV